MTRSLIALTAALVAAAALTACSKPTEPPKPTVPGAQVEGETVSFPKDSPQARRRCASSRCSPSARARCASTGASPGTTRTSRVSTPVAGRVVELRALPGAAVKRGDVLAVISSPEFGQSQAEARRRPRTSGSPSARWRARAS